MQSTQPMNLEMPWHHEHKNNIIICGNPISNIKNNKTRISTKMNYPNHYHRKSVALF